MIEVTLETIQMSLVSPHRIVVLREVDVERYLPIWIGPCEAEAIRVRLEEIPVSRPLTHDLIVNILDTLNARLSYVYINALADSTFYARLVLDINGREIEVDSRSSDAIAIAVRTGVAIYVADEVLDEAGVVPEQDITTGKDGEQNLEIFRDFLNSLDIENPPEATD